LSSSHIYPVSASSGSALHLVDHHHLRLIVAGTAATRQIIEQTDQQRQAASAELVTDVRPVTKARLQAQPCTSQVNEGFGLPMVAALVSATPAIASSEIPTREVDFVSRSEYDYDNALDHVDEIAGSSCRGKAFDSFAISAWLRTTCGNIALSSHWAKR
jgi:hypothetical protein